MGALARVDNKRRLDRQRFHSPDRFFERTLGIRISGLVETHVTVADLQEGESLALLRQRFVDDAERGWYSAGNGPQHAGSRPGHAFENLATAGAFFVIVCAHVRSPCNWLHGRDRILRRIITGRRVANAVALGYTLSP